MPQSARHREHHRLQNNGWLRAAVLGANDGILSTASLIVGVAASAAGHGAILTAGLAGLVAGAMSMAAGEYVSVSSQGDAEKAELDQERQELKTDPVHEHEELAQIYVQRGLEPALARQVADQLMAKDALGAHARDELGISKHTQAQPIQAALASAASFTTGAAVPLLVALAVPAGQPLSLIVSAASLLALSAMGALAARTAGAPLLPGVTRVTFWGALSMAVTAGIGAVFGTLAG